MFFWKIPLVKLSCRTNTQNKRNLQLSCRFLLLSYIKCSFGSYLAIGVVLPIPNMSARGVESAYYVCKFIQIFV